MDSRIHLPSLARFTFVLLRRRTRDRTGVTRHVATFAPLHLEIFSYRRTVKREEEYPSSRSIVQANAYRELIARRRRRRRRRLG